MADQWKIRPLTCRDEPVLAEMLYHAIHLPPGAPAPARSVVETPELARYYSDWGQSGDVGFAMIDSQTGVVLGAAWLRLLCRQNRGYGYLDDQTPELSIAVLPTHRGQGIGSALLRALLSAAAREFGSVSLSVSLDNPARHLYERFGFTAVSTEGTSLTMFRRFAASD